MDKGGRNTSAEYIIAKAQWGQGLLSQLGDPKCPIFFKAERIRHCLPLLSSISGALLHHLPPSSITSQPRQSSNFHPTAAILSTFSNST